MALAAAGVYGTVRYTVARRTREVGIGVAASLLFGIGTFDPVALAGAPLVLGVTAWLAAYLPARRASRMDPLAALRTD